jgi:hypothetical protein
VSLTAGLEFHKFFIFLQWTNLDGDGCGWGCHRQTHLSRNQTIGTINLFIQVARFNLSDPRQFNYLKKTGCVVVDGIDDAADFKETSNAMVEMGFTDDDVQGWSVLRFSNDPNFQIPYFPRSSGHCGLLNEGPVCFLAFQLFDYSFHRHGILKGRFIFIT